MSALVSVIIPTRNSAATLTSCLEAIRNQSYKDIELIIVDSNSTDDTLEIAEKYSATVVQTDWKLLGARYLGFKKSQGNFALLLDSDQILYPGTIGRLVDASHQFDMICLEEWSYQPETFLEKLFDADRKLLNSMPELHLDPIEGVMLARFYRSDILGQAFDNIPINRLHDVVAHDHAIIYYEAYKISSNVGILRKAVLHSEPASFTELWRKNYRYGKTTRELLDSNLYVDLLKRKTRFRKGASFNTRSFQSTILLILKGVPYYIGLRFGK